MFFSKSYTPLTFNETYIHKTISTKLQMYQENKSLTNIIFYGNNGTGKYILSQLLLESILIDQIMYIVMFIMRSIYQKRMIDQN